MRSEVSGQGATLFSVESFLVEGSDPIPGGDGQSALRVDPHLLVGARQDFSDLEPLAGAGLAVRHEAWSSFLALTLWGGVTSAVVERVGETGSTRGRESRWVWGVAVGLGREDDQAARPG